MTEEEVKEVKKEKKKNKDKEIIESLLNDNNELQEKIKYLQADMINYRKRKDEEVQNMLKFANQDLILEILPIVDNFELALKGDNLSDELQNYLAGFKIMYTRLVEVLKSFGVEEINRIGEEFDPNLEQVLLTEEDKEQPNDIVLDVLQKGYILKGRVIRPATVKINKILEKESDK